MKGNLSDEEKKRKAAVENLLRKCCEKGKLEDAERVAGMMGRKMSEKELDVLVYACINSHDRWRALEAVQRGASRKAASILALDSYKHGWTDIFLKLLDPGKISRAVLKKIFRSSIKHGWKEPVTKILFIFERNLTYKEAVAFIRNVMERINDHTEDALGIIEYVGENDRRRVKEDFLQILIKKGLVDRAVYVAKTLERGLFQHEVDGLITANAKSKRINEAVKAARLGASADCVENLVKVCIKECHADYARMAARCNNRRLTSAELRTILMNALSKGLVYVVSTVLKKNKVFPQQWEALMSKCLSNGDMEDALMVAKMRGKKLSITEIQRLEKVVSG